MVKYYESLTMEGSWILFHSYQPHMTTFYKVRQYEPYFSRMPGISLNGSSLRLIIPRTTIPRSTYKKKGGMSTK